MEEDTGVDALPHQGDKVVVADPFSLGDVVLMERVAPDRVIIRKPTEAEWQQSDARLVRALSGSSPGAVRFVSLLPATGAG